MAAETTKAGSRTLTLRLSMLHPNGKQIDYDQPVKNDKTSYDAACQMLSDRERQKVAEGWDRMGRLILETEDIGTDIVTRALHGKEWDFVGEPGVPPGKAVQSPEKEVEATPTNGSISAVQVIPPPKPAAPKPSVDHATGWSPDRSEAFLEALGELCMAHKMIVVGENLRLEAFSMKAFRRLLAMGE